ncbi:MAG: hypothetical protein KDD82_02645 [Planctomycetes bacterium]|nr:hypothetical protein [Planctomycetota bacterium]
MRAFVRDVLVRFGAEVEDEGPVLAATIPPDGPAKALHQQLGATPRFVFSTEHLEVGTQLVAAGGHVLRTIDAFLDQRSGYVYVVKPGKQRLSLKALGVKALKGYSLAFADRLDALGYDVYVSYCVRYHARERTDQLETFRVVVRPQDAILAERLEELPTEFAEWPAKPRKRAPEDAISEALAVADRAVSERAVEVGETLGEEVREGMVKDVGRLHAYYAGQIADYERSRRNRELALLRIEELEDEREVRLAELQRSTHVRAEVQPLQILVVEVPLIQATLEVYAKADEGGPALGKAPLWFDRTTGAARVSGAELEAFVSGLGAD